jgi:hypothetical protein
MSTGNERKSAKPLDEAPVLFGSVRRVSDEAKGRRLLLQNRVHDIAHDGSS